MIKEAIHRNNYFAIAPNPSLAVKCSKLGSLGHGLLKLHLKEVKMSSESSEIEKKIATDKATNNKINIPLFFSLERGKKISYLLGTNHALSLGQLPLECFKIIERCSTFVTEEDDTGQEEFYTRAILREKPSKSWVKQLPSEIAQKLEFYIAKFYESFPEELRKKADELEIWAAYQFAEQGLMQLLASHFHEEVNETTTEESSSMDHELSNLFRDRIQGLENCLSSISQYKKEANTIDDLIKSLKELILTEESCGNAYGKETKSVTENLHSAIHNYCHAAHLYDQNYAVEQNDDTNTIERNLAWLPNFLQHHQTLPGPILYGVGARHLSGEQGLLSLLPKMGFKVKRLTPGGSFDDYTYPFESHYVSKKTLSQESRLLCWMRRTYEPQKIVGMLKLNYMDFDQSQEGWRWLLNRDQDKKAALLIDRYLRLHYLTLKPEEIQILLVHSGQLHGMADNFSMAIKRLKYSLKLDRVRIGSWLENGIEPEIVGDFLEYLDKAWEPYIHATIAFFKGDKAALLKAKQSMEKYIDFENDLIKHFPNQHHLPGVEALYVALQGGRTSGRDYKKIDFKRPTDSKALNR